MDCDWVAHASRPAPAGAIASSRSRTFLPSLRFSAIADQNEVRFGETPKPARETRALPMGGGEGQ